MRKVIEGLNTYKAAEANGERVLRAWAESTVEDDISEGLAAFAEREGNHAQLLAGCIVALGGQPGASPIDPLLADFADKASQSQDTRSRFLLFEALLAGEVTSAVIDAIKTAREEGDDDTRALLADIAVGEGASMRWWAEARARMLSP